MYIHTRIDPKEKIEFFNDKNVPSTFFVVRGGKESEKLVIDRKEIIDVFWMKISDVTKFQSNFVRKSRTAWKIYL